MTPLLNLHRLLLSLLALSVVAACGPRPSGLDHAPGVPAPSASAFTAGALQPGTYTLDPTQSEIAVLVRRGGALARLGHDHVVSHPALQGQFNLPADDGRAEGEITVVLSELVVDDPALRARYALDTQPTPAAIEGTRANMLQRVLEADRFPLARLRLSADSRSPAEVDVDIELHGVTRRQRVAVDWQASGGELRARGRLVLLQSDFGMQPLTVLGGALRVEDRLEMDFDLRARRQGAPAASRPPA